MKEVTRSEFDSLLKTCLLLRSLLDERRKEAKAMSVEINLLHGRVLELEREHHRRRMTEHV